MISPDLRKWVGELKQALVAQLDRASDSDSEGRAFESHQAHQQGRTPAPKTLAHYLDGGFSFRLARGRVWIMSEVCRRTPAPKTLAHYLDEGFSFRLARGRTWIMFEVCRRTPAPKTLAHYLDGGFSFWCCAYKITFVTLIK